VELRFGARAIAVLESRERGLSGEQHAAVAAQPSISTV
jgi:hypothetical protein